MRRVYTSKIECDLNTTSTIQEQIAGAWSACYSAAVGIVAKQLKVSLPATTAVEIEVDLGLGGNEYFLQARLTLIVPGVDLELATRIGQEMTVNGVIADVYTSKSAEYLQMRAGQIYRLDQVHALNGKTLV